MWIAPLDMSHVCGVTVIVHPHSWCVYLENMERQGVLVFLLVEKIEWESPPSILVTRNPNWSQRSGTETSCVKGRY